MSIPVYAARGPIPFLFHYAQRRPGGHVVVLAAILAAVGCAIGSQYAVKNLVDVLGWQFPPAWKLWMAVGVLLVLVAGDNLLWRLAGWIAARAFVELSGDLRLDLFEHLSGHAPSYFADRFPGALGGRISTAASAALTIENSLAWTTIPPAAAVVSSIAVLGLVNWHLMATLAVVSVVLGLAVRHFAARGRHLHDRYASRAAGVSGDLIDIIGNIGLVRAFGAAGRERQRLMGIIGNEMAAQSASLRSLERLRLFHAVSVFIVTAGVLSWSVVLWRAHRITTGDVVLATTLGFTVLHASRDFAMAMVDLLQQFAKLGEAIRELGVPHEMPDAPNARPLISLGGSISFLDVCFSYPDSDRVLRDFTLHIPAGQRVGLVGRSGAGKSTVLALLQRLYDPERGCLLIDEQDIAEVTQESLHRSIAVVHQDISLFHRPLIENLRYGMPEASDADVERAAAAAHCTEFIARLPRGFDTIVGERGAKLSGGQRQRVAIARAFIYDAPIILLDEATSALDTVSERLVQDALVRLVQGRTVIAIAHRLSSLSNYDRIVVLERGRIVEDGAPRDLLRRPNGAFSQLYESQRSH
ncbi:MAG TPA: ABC transporter ATP-binding protein [Stellaceae bacterium]|jgi:ATP-binding cassette subfamily B protein|nr:ABC transporter ATP-binding protein [Stellaceae bacterium]